MPIASVTWSMSTIAAGSPIRRSGNCCGIFVPPTQSFGNRVLIGWRCATLHSAADSRKVRPLFGRWCSLRLFGVLNRNPSDLLPGNDQFLDLCGAVADLKAHDVQIALVER